MLTSLANTMTEPSSVGGIAARIRTLHNQASPPADVFGHPQEETVPPESSALPLAQGASGGPSTTNGHGQPQKLQPYADVDGADPDMNMQAYEVYRQRFGLDRRQEGIFYGA